MINLLSLLFLSTTSAINLFVASYNGNITTLSLTPTLDPPSWPAQKPFGWPWSSGASHQSSTPQFTYTLSVINTFNTSTQSPSWLLLNHHNNILYLIDEATIFGSGTLVTYSTSTGIPHELHRLEALQGGVHGVFFNSGTALAIPHYTGSALQVYTLSTPSAQPVLIQTLTFTAPVGPVPNRQDAPHPHETLLDPTGRFILVPDLGADLVRIFSFDASTSLLTELAPLVAAPGSGPRHGAFTLDIIDDGSYVFYLASEIAATVTAYKVSYSEAGGMAFTELTGGVYPSLGAGHPVPATTTGESTGVTAEIAMSPDGRFVIASNRRDLSFNATTKPISYPIQSDSLAAWALTGAVQGGEAGALEFLGLFPAGGSLPRQFAVNAAGNLIAVGLQDSGRVVVIERDIDTGVFVRQVAEVDGLGEVTCVVWNE